MKKEKRLQSAVHALLKAKGIDSEIVTKGNSYYVTVPEGVDIKKIIEEIREMKNARSK